jgi:methyl-accepting chemotaxis protein
MSGDGKNRRRLLLNTKFQMMFGLYTFATMAVAIVIIIRDYIQIFVPVFMTGTQGSQIGTPLKVLLLPGWVILTFLIFYVYMNARTLGVFQRISETCERIMQGQSIRLAFRSGDSFGFLGASFNAMVDTLKEREKNFMKTLEKTRDLLLRLAGRRDAESEIKEILKEIDTIRADEAIRKSSDTPDSP